MTVASARERRIVHKKRWWMSLCWMVATALALTSAPVEAGLFKKVIKGAVIVGAVAKYQAKKKAARSASYQSGGDKAAC